MDGPLFTLVAMRHGCPEKLTTTARTIIAILKRATSLRSFFEDSIDDDSWAGTRLLFNLRRIDDISRPQLATALEDLWNWSERQPEGSLPPEIKAACSWLLPAKKIMTIAQAALAPPARGEKTE